MQSVGFVQRNFGEYYSERFRPDESITSVTQREFGFISFQGKMIRHQSFTTKEELTAFLRDFVPRDAYISCAYYENPETEMERKGWLGADLTFDIDADHIPTSCDKTHDEWRCSNCGFNGRGVVPEKCPACGGEKFDATTWPCEVCLASAKAETVKLLNMLLRDFGLAQDEMRVFFSGHRGYHIHVENEATRNLDSIARKEVVDYVCGLGFDLVSHGLVHTGTNPSNTLRSLNVGNSGWSERIVKGVRDFILNSDEEDCKNAGLTTNVVRAIFNNRERILKSHGDTTSWSATKGIGFETWRKIAEFCVKSQSAKIDTVVTTDVHRLIRLADTLHGKTGLTKVQFPISSIDSFDPFKQAVAFKKGAAVVSVSSAPEFRLGDETFGPYKNQRVELPTAAALLLVCKGMAEATE